MIGNSHLGPSLEGPDIRPQPYPASWIDRLGAAIEGLPIPAPVFYVALWLVLLAITFVAAWGTGVLAWGALDPPALLVTAWTPYCFGFIVYLSVTAGQALDEFRPALDLSDAEFAALRREFTTLPAQPLVAANFVGVALSLASFWLLPEMAARYMGSPVMGAISVVITCLGMALALGSIYQTLRHLRLVRQTYRRATRLTLFQSSLLYAFSSLTLQIGVGWIFILYAGVVAFPDLLRNPLWTSISGLLVVSIGLALIVTLSGIQRRIAQLKTRQMYEVNALLEATFATLNQRIRDHEMEGLVELREAAAALDLQRSVLAKVPTWPWQPGTLASFVTALALPVLAWLGQVVIGRVVGW